MDLTPSAFGILLANLLPGVMALYAVGLVVPEVSKLLGDAFINDVGFGPLLLVIILAVFAGLLIGGLRTLIYEDLFFTHVRHVKRPDGEDLQAFARSDTLAAYRAAIEELYRYHRFWGGLSLSLPFLAVAILIRSWGNLTAPEWTGLAIAFMLSETISIIRAYMNYVSFNKIEAQILKEDE
jgi:hypothetical protein